MSQPEACPSYGVTRPVKICGPVLNGGTKDLRAQGKHAEVTINVSNLSFTFRPSFLHVTPGELVTVTIINKPAPPFTEPMGTYVHSFTIDSLQINVNLERGDTKTVTLTMPNQPSLMFYCTPHHGIGMVGALYTS